MCEIPATKPAAKVRLRIVRFSRPLGWRQPILGHAFLREEEKLGARRVVIISHRLWTNFFDNGPEIIGKTMPLENHGRAFVSRSEPSVLICLGWFCGND